MHNKIPLLRTNASEDRYGIRRRQIKTTTHMLLDPRSSLVFSVMLFLSLLLLLFRYSQALPTPYGGDKDFSNSTSSSDAMTPSGKRTLFGIVWSCVLTVMICAWTSVHPNIPPTTRGIAFWKRIGMMFWALIAPELILAWAVRQRFAASHIRDQYNKRHPEAGMLFFRLS